jgi:hypothetical protein
VEAVNAASAPSDGLDLDRLDFVPSVADVSLVTRRWNKVVKQLACVRCQGDILAALAPLVTAFDELTLERRERPEPAPASGIAILGRDLSVALPRPHPRTGARAGAILVAEGDRGVSRTGRGVRLRLSSTGRLVTPDGVRASLALTAALILDFACRTAAASVGDRRGPAAVLRQAEVIRRVLLRFRECGVCHRRFDDQLLSRYRYATAYCSDPHRAVATKTQTRTKMQRYRARQATRRAAEHSRLRNPVAQRAELERLLRAGLPPAAAHARVDRRVNRRGADHAGRAPR